MRRFLFAFALLFPSLGRASVVDLFDLGPATARVGAVAATTDSGSAAYYNPAGLAFRDRLQLRVGVSLFRSELALRGRTVDLARPFGVVVEAATPIPLLGWWRDKLGIGAAFHIIPQTTLKIDTPSRSEPFFPYYQNRSQRLVILPGIAFRPIPKLSLGVGMNYFAGLRGFAQGTDGVTGDLQTDLQEEFYARARVHAGVRFDYDDFRFAFAYRDRFSVPFGTVSENAVNDTLFSIAIHSNALYTPETFVWGVAYQRPQWGSALDISWRRWSKYRPPFARVKADAPLPLSTTNERIDAQSRFRGKLAHDVVRVAMSAEQSPAEDWQLNFGYAFEPSAFEPQPGVTNLIDAAKHIVGAGVTWRGPQVGKLHWAVEIAGQAHWMQNRRLTKSSSLLPDEDPSAPGRQTSNLGYPTVAGGGFLFAGMLAVVFELDPEPKEESGP